MTGLLLEWANLLLRWTHVIAAIMWIGDSFLFMWMDRSLTAPSRARSGEVSGELWMVHSGGFYEVVKRRKLLPDELPPSLHWFKWEAYTTWISGVFLLGVVYFAGGGVYLIDRSSSSIGLPAAIGIVLLTLALGWHVYDALCRSPLSRNPRAFAVVGYALVVAAAYGLTRLLSGRAAFVILGATLGTLMVANVWRVIIPAQGAMLAATRAGREVDTTPGEKAKQRSTHNHYLTLPVLFTMLSQHYPSAYGGPLNWVILSLIVLFGAAAKYVMNFRGQSNRWIAIGGAAALIAAVALTAQGSSGGAAPAVAGGAPVSFAEAHAILERRCLVCHATHPSNPAFPQPPAGVVFEDPQRIRALAPRILVRAVQTRTMPLGNLTGMTEAERRTLGAWIAQGAKIEE